MKTIPLSRGYVALVDDEDFERVSAFKWCAKVERATDGGINSVYAQRSLWENGVRTSQLLHRFILGCSARVDHQDGDGLNNQRCNLRPATPSQNSANMRHRSGYSSQYKGVCWNKKSRKWQASITKDKRCLQLGLYGDEVDAATVYNFAAHEMHGKFARFNVPLDPLTERTA